MFAHFFMTPYMHSLYLNKNLAIQLHFVTKLKHIVQFACL